ncbi:hypothetical protein Tco_0661755, partial [Tanacetum coccineum]
CQDLEAERDFLLSKESEEITTLSSKLKAADLEKVEQALDEVHGLGDSWDFKDVKDYHLEAEKIYDEASKAFYKLEFLYISLLVEKADQSLRELAVMDPPTLQEVPSFLVGDLFSSLLLVYCAYAAFNVLSFPVGCVEDSLMAAISLLSYKTSSFRSVDLGPTCNPHDPSWISLVTLFSCFGPTHLNHKERKDVLYRIPLMICCLLLQWLLLPLAFRRLITSTLFVKCLNVNDANLLNASAFLFWFLLMYWTFEH